MDCREASELITAYVDDELGGADSDFLFAHLRECVRCRERLALEREAKRLVGLRHSATSSPEELRNRIADAITRSTDAPESGTHARLLFGALSAALARPLLMPLLIILAAALGLGLVLMVARYRNEVIEPSGPRSEAVSTEVAAEPF